ncbi:MFS transporter [Streptomyces sp. NPDC002499]
MVQADGQPSVQGAPEPTPLWRNRDYNLWWIGTALSGLGTSVSTLAFPLLILASAGSAAAAGAVGACASVGLLAGLLPAGVAADRYSRRALLVGSASVQLVTMGAVFWMVAATHVWLPLIAAMALLQGLASAVFRGAAAPLVKRIVPPSQLKAAFARAEARDFGAQLGGAPLGGLLFSLARWAPFLADAVSFAAVALVSALLRTPLGPDVSREPEAEAANSDDGPGSRPKLLQDLGAGLAFIRGNTFLRYALVWSALTNLMFAGIGFMFIVTLRDHGASPSTIGTAEAIATACALCGALAAGRIVQRVSGYRIVLFVSWMVPCGVAGLIFLADRPWLAALSLGASTVFVTPLNVVFASRAIAVVPDELTARVITSMNLAAMCCGWPAPLVCGALADGFGVDVPLIVITAGLVLMAVANHVVPAVRLLHTAPGEAEEALPDADPDDRITS